MKHTAKKLLVLLLLPSLLLPLSACLDPTAPTLSTGMDTGGRFSGTVRIVTLGDSIARGYGLSDPKNECYSALVADKIREMPGVGAVELRNFGIDGMTSAELLQYQDDPTLAEPIAKADLILISIGANDILRHAKALVDTLLQIALGKTDVTLRDATLDLLAAIGEAAEPLKKNLRELLSALKEKNPDALILIQTVYNPYPKIDGRGSPSVLSTVHTAVEPAVILINGAIKEAAEGAGVALADPYAAFRAAQTDEPLTLYLSRFDPHPTALGHRLIAESISEVLNKKP